MEITPKEAYLYQFHSGRCPFEEWLESLTDRSGRAKIRARIARARAGNFGPGYRVYLGEVGHAIIILLCGGDKSSQAKDIKAARGYWADYWRRPHAAREKLS